MELNQPKPPKLASWLLSLSVAWKFKLEAEADLDELFQIRCRNWGEAYARRLYWQDVLSIWIRRSWFEELDFTHLNTFSMFKNYMKVTLRSLKKQKSYAFINVFGLAIGLAFCALIFLYVQDELTYDQMHEKRDRLYRVELAHFDEQGNQDRSFRNGPIPLGPTLQAEVPGIEHFARIFYRQHYTKSAGEAIQELVMYSDAELLSMFSFDVLEGNPENLLPNLSSVVITESVVSKYFNNESAYGKTLRIRKNEVFEDFEVTGVIADPPSNSTLRVNMMLPIEGDNFFNPQFIDRFDMNLYQTYVLLNENVEISSLNDRLDTFTDKYHAQYQSFVRSQNGWPEDFRPFSYRLNPLPEIHLSSNSDPMYSYILSGIAIAILLIACINFMTLSIGRSSRRAKEIGMRKVIGAHRHQLMVQFWGEAFLICSISLIIGVLLAELFLPVFNVLSDKTLDFNYFENWQTLTFLVVFILFTGFIAGSYPALLLSNIKPISTLKGTLKLSGSNVFTKGLVSLQFALSVCLIVGTLVMNNQLKFIQNKDLGYNKEHVLVIPLNRINGLDLAAKMRNTIGNDANIADITATGTPLGFEGSFGYGVEHNGESFNINVFTVESNYNQFMELDIIAGRDFDPNLATDSLQSIIVNETLIERMGLTDPIGSTIPGIIQGEDPHGGAVIIGVVEDHIFAAMYQEIDPAFLTMNPAWGHNTLFIRMMPADISETIATIEHQWNEFYPEIPFNYSFLDDDLYEVYQEDERWASIVNYASSFAILIACLGLFGLVALTVSSRIKEVGIRKVLGASSIRITGLFAKEFIKLVTIGVIVAIPLAYYVMNTWLQNFAYRIDIHAGHFAIAAALVLIISLATISVQTIRAGLTNPAKTLSNE
ncbi:MAG: FtsX-like permease family protein [Cyanothece sp. SIO1E1]|nr:FtsX-like permease family protein [Cyanothece sp. SIO1E1]